MRFSLITAMVTLLFGSITFGQVPIYEQPMAVNGGVLRPSQLWQDPGGNDSDTDAIAYEDFMLTQDSKITTVRWWGELAPSLGFNIAFYPQDPNCFCLQPDIFSGPFSQHDYTNVSQILIGSGLYQIEVQLAIPLDLLADTQYFITIIGLTPQPFTPWNWAEGTGTNTGTFYWQRADGGRFSRLPENRAVTLLGFGSAPTLTVDPQPLIAGQSGTFTIDNMTPSSQSYLIYSLRGLGSTFIPQLNITIDLTKPQLAGNSKVTDGNGHAVWMLPIPSNAAGRDVWFQAAQFENKTNLVATQIIN